MTTTSNAVAEQVCRAIHDRRLLTFHYNDKARVVAPYCYGISTRESEVLRAIEVRGWSSSGKPGFGKLWRLDQMIGVRVSEEAFVPDDPNYNPNDSAMTRIVCRIE